MFATIYLPNFYLQAALRYEPPLRSKPTALIEEHGKKPVIIELNTAAESAGVRKGMTPSQALARYLQVIIKARARPQENSMQEILLQSAFTLSPYVEDTAPGIATVELWDRHPADGSSARSACHETLRVIKQLAECQIKAQIGIASLPDTSFLAAHLARPVLMIDKPKAFLAPLPIETLMIDEYKSGER